MGLPRKPQNSKVLIVFSRLEKCGGEGQRQSPVLQVSCGAELQRVVTPGQAGSAK